MAAKRQGTIHAWIGARCGSACLEVPIHSGGDASWRRQVFAPCQLRYRTKDADVFGDRKRRPRAEGQRVASRKPVVIEGQGPVHGPSIVDRKTTRNPIDSVVRVLKGLDELDREARGHEVADLAVDSAAIRA